VKTRSSPISGFSPLAGCGGFTLFELLLSMTIVAVVIALVLGAFRVGYRAWEKGDRTIDSLQRLRGISDRIHRQLTATVFVRSRDDGEDSTGKSFVGTARSMRFLTDASLVPGIPRGRVIARYRVDDTDEGGQQLMFHELPLITAGPENEDIPPDEDFYRLLHGMDGISFAYLKRDEDNPDAEPEWQMNWDPAIDGNLPSAVRVRIQQESGVPPIGIVTRIAASKLE
jgi:general secretion pathway protein J